MVKSISGKCIGLTFYVLLLGILLLVPTKTFAVNFNMTEDTYVRNGTYADTNFGTATRVYAKDSADNSDDRILYYKVNFTTLSGTSVTNAKLKFYVNGVYSADTAGRTYKLLGLPDDSWSETTMTWNNQPDLSNATVLGYYLIKGVGWQSLDVTNFINSQMGDKIASFCIVQEVNGEDRIEIMSANTSSNTPYLNLTAGVYSAGPMKVPFTRFEAEGGTTNGTVLSSTTMGQIPYEASGRSCVELNATGEYVQCTSTVSANRLIVRYSLPVDPNGTASGTLSLYVNGTHSKDLTMDNAKMVEPKSDITGGYARYYDEVIVSETINANDVIKLQMDSGDILLTYYIDYFEVETAPADLTKPDSTWLSITDAPYNANGADTVDDTTAIRNCITAAASGNKKVWIPSGDFYISDTLTIPDGVEVNGAGLWYSVIHKKFGAIASKKGMLLSGNNAIRNLKLQEEDGFYRGISNQGIRLASNCTIDSVWVENISGSGIVGYSVIDVTVRNCRVRGTYQDAIHLANNSQGCLVEENFVRGAGDDGVAFITYGSLDGRTNLAKRNLVELNYWGRGITIQGGSFNTAMMNEVRDITYCSGILATAENYNNSPNQFLNSFLIQYNDIIRCGNASISQYGALWVFGAIEVPMSGDVQYNNIISEIKNGISVQRYVPSSVRIRYNTIGAPGINGKHFYQNLSAGYTPTISDNILQ